MKKAKALFAGVMIVLVAGTSAVFWYLNDQGIIGNKNDSVSEEFIVSGAQNDGNAPYYNEKEKNDPEADGDDGERDETQNGETTAAQNSDADGVAYESVNRFLSNFSLVYFAESAPYSADSRSAYELLRFAYAHTRRLNAGALVTKQTSDEVGCYSGISYETANAVLQDYLGVTVERESVYTEKNYAFFRYEDGYFYTPAADGVGYNNRIVADSVSENGDTLAVSFTVYSDGVSYDMTAEQARQNGEKYATGSAKIRKDTNGYILLAYEISK